jgi:hypothetical protein
MTDEERFLDIRVLAKTSRREPSVEDIFFLQQFRKDNPETAGELDTAVNKQAMTYVRELE